MVELTPLPLIVTANAAVGKRWANHAAEILGGVAGGLVCLLGVADLAGAPVLAPAPDADLKRALDFAVMATGLVAAVVSAWPVRSRLARLLPIDPESPVHALALTLTVIVLGIDTAVIAFTDVLGGIKSQPPLSVADLFLDELPFVIVAMVGVGLFTRRSPSAILNRLGIAVPAWRHVALAVAAAGVLFGLSLAFDSLSHAWTPEIAQRVDSTNQHVFGQLSSPLAIAAIALLPGICEEVLFRGALQPRIGILLTALLFTSVHTQYGLSLDTVSVFVSALGLGLVRRYTNTTGACVTHVGYNLLTGIGIEGAALNAAVVIEVALVAVSAYAVWINSRRPPPAARP